MSAEDPIVTAERRLRDYGGYLDLYPARALLTAAKSWRDRALAARLCRETTAALESRLAATWPKGDE